MGSSTKSKGSRRLKSGVLLQQRYRIDHFLAEGGMNAVYMATDIRTNQPVAIKCLHEMYRNNEIVQARFIDEGRIQMMLKHPNILRVFTLIEDPVLAFVMEFIEGGSLEDHLIQQGPMSQEVIMHIMLPIMSALGLAHSRGIIHRDLKPSNILMHKLTIGTYRPKMMDFGVAKVSRGRTLTQTGTTVGTLHYMSPEQIVGSKRIDGRADIYSLGITMYKLATGEVPFNASTEFALMMAQVETAPRPPRQLRANISPQFEQVILRALEKKPQHRYQSIKDFTQALVALSTDNDDDTTITEQVGHGLLKYALMADEVAQDKTREVMRSEFDAFLASVPKPSLTESSFDAMDPSMLSPDMSDSTVELAPLNIRQLREEDAQVRAMTYDENDPTQIVDLNDNMRLQLGTPTDFAPAWEANVDPIDNMETNEVVRPRQVSALKKPPHIVGVGAGSHERTRPKMDSFHNLESATDVMPHLNFDDDSRTKRLKTTNSELADMLNSEEVDLSMQPGAQPLYYGPEPSLNQIISQSPWNPTQTMDEMETKDRALPRLKNNSQVAQQKKALLAFGAFAFVILVIAIVVIAIAISKRF